MAEQGRKLMATLAVVVHGLDNLNSLLPAASALAKRHVAYGVKAADYAPVGAALLWTLEQGLGDQWTSELAAAWSEAYTVLSKFMITEAYVPAQGRHDAAHLDGIAARMMQNAPGPLTSPGPGSV
jgi:hemoglobin-like flavoprotein